MSKPFLWSALLFLAATPVAAQDVSITVGVTLENLPSNAEPVVFCEAVQTGAGRPGIAGSGLATVPLNGGNSFSGNVVVAFSLDERSSDLRPVQGHLVEMAVCELYLEGETSQRRVMDWESCVQANMDAMANPLVCAAPGTTTIGVDFADLSPQ